MNALMPETTSGSDNPTSVTISGVAFSEHEIGLEAQYHPASTWQEARHEALRALVIRELLLRECIERGVLSERPTDERHVQAAIERLIEQVVDPTPVTNGDCQAYYETHPEKFKGPALYDASHILIAGSASAAQSEEARQKAQSVLEDLKARPHRFENVAREVSACPTGGSGGRLGQIAEGETEAEFEAALHTLEPGQIATELVETRHGFHVVRLEARAEPQLLPLELVREKIRGYLEEHRFRKALARFIEQAAERHQLRGFDLYSRTPKPPPTKEVSAEAPVRGPRRLPVLSH